MWTNNSYSLYRRDNEDLRPDQRWELVRRGFASVAAAAHHALSVPDGVFLVEHNPSGFWTNCQWLNHADIRRKYPLAEGCQ